MLERPQTREKPDDREFLQRCGAMLEVYKTARERQAGGHESPEIDWHAYPPPEYSFKMGKSTVSLAGYWHEMPYFNAHEEQIRNHIKGSTVLVTELARLAEGALKDKTVDVPDDFFEEVEKVAWREGVPVVANDPHLHHRIQNTGLMRDELRDKDAAMTAIKGSVFLGALGSITAALGLGIYDKVKSRMDETVMSRRSFLLGSAASGVAALTAGSLYGTLISGGLGNRHERRAESPVGPLLFDAEDYRDVATAFTIATLAKDLPANSKISVVYGSGHMPSIKKYLDNPNELAIKMALYQAAYGAAIPASIVHTPRGTELRRSAPEDSWLQESQADFAARKQREGS